MADVPPSKGPSSCINSTPIILNHSCRLPNWGRLIWVLIWILLEVRVIKWSQISRAKEGREGPPTCCCSSHQGKGSCCWKEKIGRGIRWESLVGQGARPWWARTATSCCWGHSIVVSWLDQAINSRILFLPFCPSVLKPDFDLRLRQAERQS